MHSKKGKDRIGMSSGNILYGPSVLPMKERAFSKKESYETLKEKDIELLNILKSIDASSDKKPDNLDHTKCYSKMAKLRSARWHICGGIKDMKGSLCEKCVHCRFFFPVPTVKEE